MDGRQGPRTGMPNCWPKVSMHLEGPAVTQNHSRISGIFLGYRINAELEHKFQALLHDSYAEISILQEKFRPSANLRIVTPKYIVQFSER